MNKIEFNKCLEAIKSGNKRGIEKIYYEYYGKITFIATLLTNDVFESKDIASQIMLYILENAKKLETVNNPNAWISTIARNHAINFIRKDSKFIKTEEIKDSTLLDNVFSEEYFDLVEFIKRQTKQEQQIFEMHFIYGYKYKEISEKLNLPLGSIKRIIHDLKLKIIKIYKN